MSASRSWYQERKVLITGGSSGIGLATARQLVAEGAHVHLLARGAARLEAALGELIAQAANGPGREARVGATVLDVSDREAVNACMPGVIEQLGGLDVLINNAGITHPGHVQDIPDEVFDAMMAVNYFGAVHVTRACIPHLVTQRRGHIAFVSSVLGFMGVYGYTAYAASKFALVGFAECLRQEMLEHRVGVSILYPPDTDTPQLHAEDLIKPAETRAISGTVKTMTAEQVAGALLGGVRAGRYHIVPGAESKFVHFMQRHFPWVVRLVIDRELKKHLRSQR